MKALVTGLNGTIGQVFKKHLESDGHKVVGWDRSVVPIDHYASMEHFVRVARPDVVYHLAVNSRPTGRENENWIVNYEWPSELAWICRKLEIKFIFLSTVMVFSDYAKGPFTVASVPDANKGYGFEKRIAESRVMYQNPDTIILRVGWQIGHERGTNNMFDHLSTQFAEKQVIRASTEWYPACSFLEDTVQVMKDAISYTPGLYLVDSNEKWNFYDIAQAVNLHLDCGWTIEPTQDFKFDQRMIDSRVSIPVLSHRLTSLP